MKERRPASRHDDRTHAGSEPGTRWVITPEPIDSTPILRDYFTDVVSRYHGRPATETEVDAAIAEEPSDDLACFLVGRYAGTPSGCVGVRLIYSDGKYADHWYEKRLI